ncbi:transcriptional regulator [Comamonas suwonensis]|uniref:Cro/Cl family transcriptional regulator n=1 Tax=Comamonas suwonensis TaxID=2606214 RepID=A0A843BEM0_9BURK|nr:Cro/Cl family transcriptional regulator [Comamonas suwonensis]MBI1625378.1 Cro/Cl family transcriptional regulator [Comamonas suwonensis]
MKQLTIYLNGLTKQEQADFAGRCGTTVGYMRKVCSLGGLLREKVCALAEAHSAGAVTRKDLRPDDWTEIWPELQAKQAITTTETTNV